MQGMDPQSLQQLQGCLAQLQQNALPGQTQIQFTPPNPPAVVLSQEEHDRLDDFIKHHKVKAYKAATTQGATMEEAEKAAEAAGEWASQQPLPAFEEEDKPS